MATAMATRRSNPMIRNPGLISLRVVATVRCKTGTAGERRQPLDIAQEDKRRSFTGNPPAQKRNVSLRFTGQNDSPFFQETSLIFWTCRARRRSMTSSGGRRQCGCARAASLVLATTLRSRRSMTASRSCSARNPAQITSLADAQVPSATRKSIFAACSAGRLTVLLAVADKEAPFESMIRPDFTRT